jgi:hypothetical protein
MSKLAFKNLIKQLGKSQMERVDMSNAYAKLNALVFLIFSSVCFSVLAQSEQEGQPEPAPWYAVEAVAGVMTTGECIETMSAVQVLEAVKFGLANIVSEKKVGGKVTQLTFQYQGQRGTIYREKAACEVVARAAHKKKNTTPDKYK